MIERLEIHSLANPDPTFTFALIGDYGDALSETTERDFDILQTAQEGIAELNERYPVREGEHAKFHLFHRKRLWNPAEGKWMGWERKRGKLLEFNHLLRGVEQTTFEVMTADRAKLHEIKYVITLDSDSVLPRDAARKLVGTIIHPLNRAQYDSKSERVTRGYGILQPRVSISALSATSTRFARVYSGNVGIDPYTTAVSDVYQDLFGEGTFTGKGLYDVDAFELAMRDRVPENTVLSHDLFESAYARSALVTDVEFFDDYPTDFEMYLQRLHRWTRGDWQISGWLLPQVPADQGKTLRNPLSMISRWKIFDNLRRSLTAPVTMVALLSSWSFFPGHPGAWTALVLLGYLFPVYSTFFTGNWMKRRGATWGGHFVGGYHNFRIQVGQIFLTLAFLPDQAWTQIDAIIRVHYRKWISHQKLLEWTAFSELKSRSHEPLRLRDYFTAGPIVTVVAAVAMSLTHTHALIVAAPFLGVWALNPLLRRYVSRRAKAKQAPLGVVERSEFRGYARLTWNFFEQFVTSEGNFLAPDNFQEDPHPIVAFRTSPTNMGLQLLSMASAYDLGYIGRSRLVDLTEKVFETLKKLHVYRGHFFNWYDTKTLEPLNPRYVSTVDSGNLAGHLVTFRQFLEELLTQSVPISKLKIGFEDTLVELDRELARIRAPHPSSGTVSMRQLRASISELILMGHTRPDELWLDSIAPILRSASDMLDALIHDNPSEIFGDAERWMRTALLQLNDYEYDRAEADDAYPQRLAALRSECTRYVQEMDFIDIWIS
ncbi:MAG: hypothetical protein EOP09_03670 [Proteobacteria bacterium]|nr:MAG: hypothetical protein EOP09_03670 [Pseudomonadota bacterium]